VGSSQSQRSIDEPPREEGRQPNKSTTVGPTGRREEVTRSQRSMRPLTPQPSGLARKKREIQLCVNKGNTKPDTQDKQEEDKETRGGRRTTPQEETRKKGENNEEKRTQVGILTQGSLVCECMENLQATPVSWAIRLAVMWWMGPLPVDSSHPVSPGYGVLSED
jgi:hypothetical protein